MQPYGLPYHGNVSQEDFEDTHAYCLSTHHVCSDRKGQISQSACLSPGMTNHLSDSELEVFLTRLWSSSALPLADAQDKKLQNP